MSAYPPIADYAIIGDCRSAALISRDASIDWLCLPRFDGPSVFTALLDQQRGGRFRIAPTGPFEVTRRYVDGTNVLQTTFRTPDGAVRVTDLMPVADEETKTRELWSEHEILRRIEGLEGQVEVEVYYEPRLDYARTPICLRAHPQGALIAEDGSRVLLMRSDIPLTIEAGGRLARARPVVRTGDSLLLAWSFTQGWPAVMPAEGAHALRQIDGTIAWWRAWSDQCTYDWEFRDIIVRSALTLKLLTYAPSGAIIAAPTTSLPEHIGGVRNWDYRYCWLRDASLTLRALLDLGYNVEGEAFLSWLLHATRLTRPKLQILYDVYGEARLPESELDHLEGYRGSRPVRVGNKAAEQVQLDVYGEVADAVHQYVIRGGRIDRATGRLLVGLGNTVTKMWRDPDEGIWEPRSGKHQHTHSKVMCWVALDRLIALHDDGHLKAPVDAYRRERDEIRRVVEAHGWNASLESYTSALDMPVVDASLLRLAFCGFADPRGERMRGTRRAIDRQLTKNGLVYRYFFDDGLPGDEGAFGICSFWAVEACALSGNFEEALAWFERLLSYANDVGLFAEEIDPDTGEQLGNFPQAFTHVGLINTALTLARLAGRPQEQPAGRKEGKI
ncbi:MAG TPA: glycoside hydrolase family 15 protein [Vicinamibacterales bacterium]|nr:glycoside hydrolase family 15 protein [Vicinamibacterales bacterium]